MGINEHDVIIIGGGVIGASIAREVSKFCSRDVAVIDGNHPGKASLAAVGMLTPACEWDTWTGQSTLDILNDGKRELFALAETLATELDWHPSQLGFRFCRFTMLAFQPDTRRTQERCHKLLDAGEEVVWLTRDELCDQEGGLNRDSVYGAISIGGQGLINPRLLLDALKLSAMRSGAVWYSDYIVSSIERHKNKWLVRSSDGLTLSCNELVVAAGAWSYEVCNLLGHYIPTTPVRGQIIELTGPENITNSVVFMPGAGCGSFAERAPGKYLLGTSEEHTSVDALPTVQVVANLFDRGERVFRRFNELRISDIWTGFRPATTDDQPIVGSLGEGLHVATGHHRNGIMLSALTGTIVGNLLKPKGSKMSIPAEWDIARQHKPFYRHGSRY